MPQAPRRARSAASSSRRSSSNFSRRGRRGGPSVAGSGQLSPAKERDRALDAALDAAAAETPENLPETFAEAGVPGRLVDALSRRGMTAPFAIQSRTLRDALSGRDILGRAQTGSGKTLAFGVPMLARLGEQVGTRAAGSPGGLVLVPTRELAQQVTNVLRPLGRALQVDVLEIYGGASMRKQVFGLRDGADLVVATPGRLIDLVEQGECDLSQVEITVLDEADFMADLGFMPAVTKLLDMTRSGSQRMLFSATLDRGVGELVERYLDNPAFQAVASAAAPVESVDHRVFVLSPDTKVPVAAEIAGRPGRTLFFVRTKHGADRLAKQLRREGVEAAAIHGDLKQGARRRALSSFAGGEPRVLIATDVAARGIHVDDVDLVVHFDPAGDHKDYLHRSGRTARAGATGTVVSLVFPDQRREVNRLHESAKVSANTVDVEPGHDAVREVATSGTPIVIRRQDFDRPRRPRREGGGGGYRSDRPRGERTDRPRGDRSDRFHSDRSGSDRPRGERSDRPRTERSDRPRGEHSDRPRADRSDRPRGERPDRPRTERSDRPRTDRSDRQPRGDRQPRTERQPGKPERQPRPDSSRAKKPRHRQASRVS
ncbi:DEAD/DEAH box helicase [Flindersiella endophytica]